MESAALFCCASALGVRCGSAFHVIWNQERDKAGLPHEECHDTQGVIQLAVQAVAELMAQDGQ